MGDRTYDAKTVADCYRIARREARAFQRIISSNDNKLAPRDPAVRAACIAARAAADRIAIRIRYGHSR